MPFITLSLPLLSQNNLEFALDKLVLWAKLPLQSPKTEQQEALVIPQYSPQSKRIAYCWLAWDSIPQIISCERAFIVDHMCPSPKCNLILFVANFVSNLCGWVPKIANGKAGIHLYLLVISYYSTANLCIPAVVPTNKRKYYMSSMYRA
jgi:hypothetical protein